MAERVHSVGDPHYPTTLIEDPAHITDNAVLAFFLEYWRAATQLSGVPLKTSFRPQDVRAHLPWVCTADALPGFEDFRYRVVGSRVTNYLLRDARGRTIREAYSDADETFVRNMLRLYHDTCVNGVPIRVTGPASRYLRVNYPSYDSLYLPYSSDGTCVDHVVGILWYDIYHLAASVASRSILGGSCINLKPAEERQPA